MLGAPAHESGLPFGSHRSLKLAADRLAEKYEGPTISDGFVPTQQFHADFHHDIMDEDELHGVGNRFVVLLGGCLPCLADHCAWVGHCHPVPAVPQWAAFGFALTWRGGRTKNPLRRETSP